MRSIDLNWLSKKDKGLPLPDLQFELLDVGGYYTYPNEINKNGLITISTDARNSPEMTLAHEWRHHYQYHNGIELNSIGWNQCEPDLYEQQIKDYFTKSTSEMSALRFQLGSVTNYGLYEMWIEWLYPFVSDVLKRPTYSFNWKCF